MDKEKFELLYKIVTMFYLSAICIILNEIKNKLK